MSERVRSLPLGVVVAAVILLAGWLFLARQLVLDRVVTASTPTAPAVSEATLGRLEWRPGARLCIHGLGLDSRSEVLVVPTFAEGARIEAALSGPDGFRATASSVGDRAPARLALSRVPGGDLQPVDLCMRNAGTGPIELATNADPRGRAPLKVVLDGIDRDEKPAIRFVERGAHSLVSRAPEIARRAGVLRPWWASQVAFLVVGALILVAAPLALLAALRRAASSE